MIKDLIQYLGVLTPLIIGALGLYVNFKLNKNKKDQEAAIKKSGEDSDKKVEAINKAVMDKLNGHDLSLVEIFEVLKNLKDMISSHVCKEDFIENFANSVRFVSNEILSWTKQCDDKYKSILSFWSESIITFGLIYYKDKNRKENKDVFKKHLTQEIERLIANFYNICDSNVSGLKRHNGKPKRFSKLLKESNLHNRTFLLVSVLSENGFNKNEEIIQVFSKYVNDFFELFFTGLALWDTLENNDISKNAA